MKQQEIVKKIGVILKELQEQYQFIEKTKQPINDLELELFVANGHFLTDHIEILRKINEQEQKALVAKKSTITQKFFEPVIQPVRIAPEKKELAAEYTDFEPAEAPVAEVPAAKAPEPEPELPSAPPVIEEPIVEQAPEEPTYQEPVIKHELVLDEDDIAYTEEEEEPAAHSHEDIEAIDHELALRKVEEHFTIPEITPTEIEPVANFPVTEPEVPSYAKSEPVAPEPPAEDFERPPLTLNQILSAQRAGSGVGASLPPISDLRSAINLNDKMLYVKDLFNGYSLSYSEAIELLNRMDSFAEADQFLKANYSNKNDWDEKKATADRFYALLRRRFA